jgi:hypothetical protein
VFKQHSIQLLIVSGREKGRRCTLQRSQQDPDQWALSLDRLYIICHLHRTVQLSELVFECALMSCMFRLYSRRLWCTYNPAVPRCYPVFQCCGAEAGRSRNFWPELPPVFEVSAPAQGQIKVFYFMVIRLEQDHANDLNRHSFQKIMKTLHFNG